MAERSGIAPVPQERHLGQRARGLGEPGRVLEAVVTEGDRLTRGQAPGLPRHADPQPVRLVDGRAGHLERGLLREDDPVHPVVRLEALDGQARLHRGVEGPGHRGIVRGDPVEQRAQREDPGPGSARGLDRVSKREDGVGVVPGEADRRHAVREIEARPQLRDEM